MTNSKTHILHMDLDSFFVSVERLKNPNLVGLPVIIGGTKQRGIVSSCSYEARKFGVHSAMSSYQAHLLCPHGIFISTNFSDYSYYSKMVTQIIADEVPVFEKASIDEFYIDLTGMDKYFGCFRFAKELRNSIMEKTGLPISFGLASNKVVAKMATNKAKPNGYKYIEPGKEIPFLDPLPISDIPSLGKSTASFLQSKQIHTIRQIRELNPKCIEKWLGKHGLSLWKRAHGLGSTTIRSNWNRKSISKEHTFFDPISDKQILKSLLHHMVEELSHQLRQESKRATTISLKMRTPDFKTISKQMTFPATNFEHEIIPILNSFFDQVFIHKPLRLFGIRLSGLTDMAYQINLFDSFEKQVSLYAGVDAIKQRFGKHKVHRGSSMKKLNRS